MLNQKCHSTVQPLDTEYEICKEQLQQSDQSMEDRIEIGIGEMCIRDRDEALKRDDSMKEDHLKITQEKEK